MGMGLGDEDTATQGEPVRSPTACVGGVGQEDQPEVGKQQEALQAQCARMVEGPHDHLGSSQVQ
jgi:hypothetical protein